MQFLFPTFLWSLLAVAVPIAIHLFNFRRTRRVYFSNVSLLKSVEMETSSFRRLKQYLILATRVLAIAALAFAFAQPYLPGESKTGTNAQSVTSAYIDNSFSMQNEDNNQRYLDIATGKLDQLLTLFRNATRLQLLTNDFDAQEQQLTTTDRLKDRLTTLKLSHTPRSLPSIYKRQTNLLGRYAGSGKNQLFWFSDFQKSTAGDLANLKIDSLNRLFIVPVQAKATQNVYVDSVWLNTPFVREFQNNVLYVRVSNAGNDDVQNLVVKLFLDDVQVSTAPVSLAPKGSATTAFNFTVRGKGFKRGRVTFDDLPITFDNEYFFVLNASPVIRVLHLYGQAISSRAVENVFDNDSLFTLRSLNANNADIGLLKQSDLVVLESVERVEGAMRSEVENFVRRGGSVLIIPPSNPDMGLYGGFLSALGVGGVQSRTSEESIPLANPERNSPFFSDVFEQSVRQENLEMPVAKPVWQWQAGGARLLNLRSGDVFLSQSSSQRGKVYVLANPLTEAFGNFAQNALFVPVMYKMAAQSVREQRTAYSFDENTINLTVPEAPQNTIFKLKKDKVELIPVQRLNGNQLLLELPKSNQLNADQELESGYYELQKDGQTQQLLAFNHDNQESQLDYYSPDELRRIFANQPNVQVFDNVADGDFVKEFQKQNIGTSLWKYFLWAALLFLLMEILVIRFVK
ncbi:MAG: BatA domain-containing protein [Spirosomataceae bacterium]